MKVKKTYDSDSDVPERKQATEGQMSQLQIEKELVK